ncbi:MAG TPA: hypothetical protein DHU96_33770 [Actinobacteria bacterium]|nr:hypothetical protein [Actinomycetota bacterium]
MAPAFTTITTELMEHADGRPVVYIGATTLAVFTYQQPDGTYVIDIHIRDDIPCGRLRLLFDGESLPSNRGTAIHSQVSAGVTYPPTCDGFLGHCPNAGT